MIVTTTFIRRNGKVVERKVSLRESKKWVTGAISDTMEPIKHMGTGRVIDSKSKFRADTKASGCVEIGNETPKARQPIQLDRGQRREAIRQSLYNYRNGR